MVASHAYQILPTSSKQPQTVWSSQSARSRRRAVVVLLVLCLSAAGVYTCFHGAKVVDYAKAKFGPHPEALRDDFMQSRYLIPAKPGPNTTQSFYHTLERFVQESMPRALHAPLLGSLVDHRPPQYPNLVSSWDGSPVKSVGAMVDYRHIFQTDKKPPGQVSQEWVDMNKDDGWKLDYYMDNDANAWVERTFGDVPEGTHGVHWAWQNMHRGVLRADFLRYLLPLIKGGVYTDTDTRPQRPILEWGKLQPETLDISATDGPDWKTKLAREPQVVVGVDIDVHKHETWHRSWPRALGICQWALGAAPHHPIFIEVARRVVNGTEVVVRAEERSRRDILPPARARRSDMGQSKQTLGVIEWTGPAVFTDSVLAYLLARYDVTWHRLRDLKRPLRIGEVLVLPITAFSPGGERDFGAEGWDSPQCDLVHDFAGSWKGDGW